MPAIDHLIQAVSFLQDHSDTATLALARFGEADGTPVFRSLNISKDVADEFRSMASERAKKVSRLRDTGDLKLIKYTAGYKPDEHEIEYVELSDDPLGELVNSIPRPTQIVLLGDLDDFVDSIRFYMLLLSGGNRRAILFRRYSRNKELLRSKNLVIRLLGDRYERLAEPAFQFDSEFDALLFKGHLFVLNKSNFQHIFRYYELLREVAEQSLDAIGKAVPIANFDEFRDSCRGHLQKLEKLRNISQKPYLKKITIKDIKRTIAKFKLKVGIEKADGVEKIVFDKDDRWAILNLLDDAYLGSEMTGINYEANSKREV